LSDRTISVVIPSFNAAGTLRRSIDSVLAQSRSASEVLVLDDGSTDETRGIVESYGSAVRYFFQENQGLSGARNSGIELTTGDWLAFHDADDEWLPTKLERQGDLLDRHPDIVWSACNPEEVRGGSLFPGLIPRSVRGVLEESGRARFFVLAAAGVLFPAGGFLIRREVFNEVGTFDRTLKTGGDRDMWWRIALRHPEIAYVPDVEFRWYSGTPGSLSKLNRDRSRGVRTVRDAARRASRHSEDAWKDFEPYGRLLAIDYQFRQACGEVQIDKSLLGELSEIFPPSPIERGMIAAYRLLPRRLARAVAARVRPRALAGRVSATAHGFLGPTNAIVA
jgi:glycosyltransferase involved in cell wall biosynthesis